VLTTGCSRPPTAHEWAAVAENPSAKPALVRKRVAVPTALATTGFSFNDEPIVKSQHELALATSGSHNLRRRSNCNLCACSFPPCATRSPGRGRACPTLPGSAAMYTEGTASRPPTAQGLADIGVQENEICTRVVAQGPRSGPSADGLEGEPCAKSLLYKSLANWLNYTHGSYHSHPG
jgi:hypothetical protein